jgi:hypothetical protein
VTTCHVFLCIEIIILAIQQKEKYMEKQTKKIYLVGTEEWHSQPREGKNSVRKRLYLEYVYRGQGPQRQDASKICGGAKTSGAWLIRKFNCKKRLTHLLNSCSPGESWGCGILPRVIMSQEKAESCKRQAASHKQQASSKVGSKAFGGKRVRQIVARHYVTKTQGASGKLQAPSSKHQAASHELLAL